jgi:hypothetical protein
VHRGSSDWRTNMSMEVQEDQEEEKRTEAAAEETDHALLPACRIRALLPGGRRVCADSARSA